MRAVQDSLAAPLRVKWGISDGPRLGLMVCHGKSIAQQSEGRTDKKIPVNGWAGEKVAPAKHVFQVDSLLAWQ